MLCSRFLKSPTGRHNALYRTTERIFDGWLSLYGWTLRGVMRHRVLTIGVTFATLAVTVYLYGLVPKGFIPSQDTGYIVSQTQFPQDSSFDAMVATEQRAAAAVAANPNVDHYNTLVSATSNFGRLSVRLKPRSERRATPEQVIEQLRPVMNKMTGAQQFFTNPPLVRIGSQNSRSLYQVTLQAQDLPTLYRAAVDMERRMREIPGLQDVNSDLQVASPELTLGINRDRASALGVRAGQIENALYSAFGARQVSTIFTPTNDYMVIMELLPQYQRDANAVHLLYLRSSSGKLVPLDSVTTPRNMAGPLQVSHFGQLPSVTISFNTRPGVSLGDAVASVQQASREVLPASVRPIFQGTAAAFQNSLTGLGLLLVMAILVIYMVLGILYESLIHPLTILSGLPSAGLGALVTLLIFHNELNIYSFVGIIMLIGIVKKNAIMMIDFALEAQRTQGASAESAILEACMVRFRPIMMTTAAALMGTLPIALGIGAGGEARRPLGLAVVGGLVVSQLLTLYITPVVYIYMERFSSGVGWFRRRKQGGRMDAHPVLQK
jgi:HAE1 family hydrophobic/amphiphilic exporter-1